MTCSKGGAVSKMIEMFQKGKGAVSNLFKTGQKVN